MDLSVVVPTLDSRERLARCLDALAERAPGAEVIVVNGPSTDGTTGMVRDRSDVDVLVEIADRNRNAARNAGLARSRGGTVAFVDGRLTVEAGWLDGVRDGLDDAAAATGPTNRELAAGLATEHPETTAIAGRTVTRLNPGNLAVDRAAADALDGFDEHVGAGGAADMAHRLADTDRSIAWEPAMSVRRGLEADGGVSEPDWGTDHRARAYRLAKNYGVRPAVPARLASRAARDAVDALRGVLAGERDASNWLGAGRNVLSGLARGYKDGLVARARDRTDRRNPNGRSARRDRAVEVYDRR